MSKHRRPREYTYCRRLSQELTFTPGPPLTGYQVQWDKRQRIVYIDQVLIPCTPTEFRLLELLLEQSEQRISAHALIARFDDAARADCELAKAARQKLARLICRLRTKLWPCGLDVVCLMGYGYMLMNPHAPAHSPLL